MFFILSKTLYYLAMPLIWIVFFLFMVVFSSNKKKWGIITLVTVLFFSNDALSDYIFSSYEVDPQPYSEYSEYEYGIVLTGVVQVHNEPRDRVFFNKGADRITHALDLYKRGIIKNILITGGYGGVSGEVIEEAPLLKSFLLTAGVPENHIIVESKSRNTRENALFTKAIIEKKQINSKVLLITSAFHMRRSAGCFNKVGILFDQFSTDLYTSVNTTKFSKFIIPNPTAIYRWHVLIHEIIGYVAYSLMGYI